MIPIPNPIVPPISISSNKKPIPVQMNRLEAKSTPDFTADMVLPPLSSI